MTLELRDQALSRQDLCPPNDAQRERIDAKSIRKARQQQSRGATGQLVRQTLASAPHDAEMQLECGRQRRACKRDRELPVGTPEPAAPLDERRSVQGLRQTEPHGAHGYRAVRQHGIDVSPELAPVGGHPLGRDADHGSEPGAVPKVSAHDPLREVAETELVDEKAGIEQGHEDPEERIRVVRSILVAPAPATHVLRQRAADPCMDGSNAGRRFIGLGAAPEDQKLSRDRRGDEPLQRIGIHAAVVVHRLRYPGMSNLQGQGASEAQRQDRLARDDPERALGPKVPEVVGVVQRGMQGAQVLIEVAHVLVMWGKQEGGVRVPTVLSVPPQAVSVPEAARGIMRRGGPEVTSARTESMERPVSEGVTHVSVVIPAYNEERRLGSTLNGWLDYLTNQSYTYELLVVDDGSTDNTSSLVLDLAQRFPTVRLYRLEPNGGKGAAVKEGVMRSEGDYVFYVDADLNVPPAFLAQGLAFLQSGYDVVVGTRSLRDYIRTERNAGRVVAGALYQLVRRVVTLPTVRDTQCGFKGFTRDCARRIFPKMTVSSFAFDVEVLFLARKFHARIKQMPVTVEYRAGSTVKWRRQLLPALLDIVRVRANGLRGRYD